MSLGPWEIAVEGCGDCRNRRLGFDSAIALGRYKGPVKELCLQLKHESSAWLAAWVADLLLEARGEALRKIQPAWVVPVPLHWTRRLQRGYNQAEALARSLARRLGSPSARLLQRVVATPVLAGKSRKERASLLDAAFRVRGGRLLKGQTVLLVDDVLTSGATCGAAARALKRAGAKRVIAVVIGRAQGET